MADANPSSVDSLPVSAQKPRQLTRRGSAYEPAIGPRMKILLFIIFGSAAFLGASGAYLTAIRILEWARSVTVTNQFTLGMFMAHIIVGILIVLPFLYFGISHLVTARKRPNRLAVRLGIALFATSLSVGLSGLALIQLEKLPQLPTGTASRSIVYYLHVLAPLAAVGLYVLHRRAGPEIRWKWGIAWGTAVAGFVVAMCFMHSQDPRKWYVVGPKEGEKYFEPSKMRTSDGNFIPAAALMMDDYCIKCHKDIYKQWFHSAHHFSSFNNPPYLFSVRNTRKESMKREGSMRASRWCAGCHDVVPFASGAFDDPNYDDVHDPTADAGITCTVCHAITNVNSPVGNAAYTIEEPQHYPFAYSNNALLQWLNNQVVKAKPDFHKKTFLKPLHRTAEFCSTCHKVSIPIEVTHYREFVRGQDHYDTYLLSGVSGVGARSFYYPPYAQTNCNACHMPLKSSLDFGSRDFDGTGVRKVHGHHFPGANTGLPYLLSKLPGHANKADDFRAAAATQAEFLRGDEPPGSKPPMSIDIFGVKEGGTIDGKLHAPLRPRMPKLKPGSDYLVEVVIRTLNMGHPYTQGTSDSNETWVDFEARLGQKILGRSGGLSGPGESGTVDEWAHFVNVLMLDRDGHRINRRNPEDIFTPLYSHQIPPGAAQVVHYRLHVPSDARDPIRLTARLRYRKFDFEYMDLVHKDTGAVPTLPIVDLCEDEVILPVTEGQPLGAVSGQSKPLWQRWNDYGIGCFLEGGPESKKGEFRQAEEAFLQLTRLEVPEAHSNGYLNAARVYFAEGRLNDAVEALNKAKKVEPPAWWWTVAWFNGLVNAQNGHLDDAISDFENILDTRNQPVERGFDFRRDFVVINELGNTLFKRAQQEDDVGSRDRFLLRAIGQFERTLQIDPEDVDAHYGLAQCFGRLGDSIENPAVAGASQIEEHSAAAKRQSSQPVNPDGAKLLELAGQFADLALSRDQRLLIAQSLAQAVVQYGQTVSTAARSKLPVLQELIGICRPIFDRENERDLRGAAARVLSNLYRQTHAIYRPDDNARDRTMRIYRENHPAAAAATEAIVIYPLNRKGAPGL
jgi:tetratricopeptide (TPR) repeat protein